ncbi:MAG: BMP family ABC transporter substrate-binding protein [Lachnospiraceae bacterium]|nr:BMP family ABC transporter substrate-binding protein [Lachnospiraceae bacterium]
MKKRLLAMVTATVMALSLVACGGSGGSSGGSASTTAAPAESSTAAAETSTPAEAPADSGDFKVCIITDVGGVNDQSFNQSAWEGAQRAASELGITANYLESKTDSDYTPNIETAIDEGYDLIICVGYMLADATRTAAEAHPDQKFAIIDDSTNSDLSNVTCLMFEQCQCSYLVGYLAGKMTESNTVGFVLGMAFDTMHEFGYGYVAGVLDANPDAKVLQANANNFGDSAVGKTLSGTMISQQADVIYHAAGGTGLGVIEACQEAGIWAIGVDSDQSHIAPGTVLSSAMKRVDNAVYDISKLTLEGSFPGGVKTYSLENAGVDIAPTTDNIPAELLAEIEQVKADIISGTISVPKNKAEFEAAHGAGIYELAD